MNRRSFQCCVLVVGLLGGCTGTDPRTQVMVTVDADAVVRADLETLRVEVRGGPGEAEPDDWRAVGEPLEWSGSTVTSRLPVVIGLVPSGDDASRGFEVVATALDGSDSPLSRVRVRSGYVRGRTLRLPIVLRAECAATTCDEGQVPPETLEPWTGVEPTDAGPPGPRDAGELDGGPGDPDGGPGDPDGGPADSGPPSDAGCTADGDCDDDDPCTDDLCAAARCLNTPNTGAACDDGIDCTEDVCDRGVCIGTDACASAEVCNTSTGECRCASDAARCSGTCTRSFTCRPGSTRMCSACEGATQTCTAACTWPSACPCVPSSLRCVGGNCCRCTTEGDYCYFEGCEGGGMSCTTSCAP